MGEVTDPSRISSPEAQEGQARARLGRPAALGLLGHVAQVAARHLLRVGRQLGDRALGQVARVLAQDCAPALLAGQPEGDAGVEAGQQRGVQVLPGACRVSHKGLI